MAIEDGYILAACLQKHFDDPAIALSRYEDLRRERTGLVVRRSHENRKHAFNPALADADAIPFFVTGEWQRTLAKERLDWLYSYDATTAPV